MRQRKTKNIQEKLNRHEGILIKDPAKNKGIWNREFSTLNPIYLEIGCGKGKFISTLSFYYPQGNYIGIEGNETVALRALERITNLELETIKIIPEFIRDPEDWFDEGEVAGIYLNFSDPWPKERHSKRRLTSENYFNGYKKILKAGGTIEIKTDNNILFDFTLDTVRKMKFEIMELSRDLHKSNLLARECITEYEENFSNQGLAINYLKVMV